LEEQEEPMRQKQALKSACEDAKKCICQQIAVSGNMDHLSSMARSDQTGLEGYMNIPKLGRLSFFCPQDSEVHRAIWASNKVERQVSQRSCK